ncbi:MAG: DUF433 domain-containing protein [Planctomycetes bacterium]|nr:DUF433 domain-containing protein [Planctomycetota bacterium]
MQRSVVNFVERSPDVLAGALVFRGTRVEVQALFDYVESGDRLADFLEDFPSVTRAQAVGTLALVRELLRGHARAP